MTSTSLSSSIAPIRPTELEPVPSHPISSSMSRSSSAQSFESFVQDIAGAQRLGDMKAVGQEARTRRGRRARAATVGRSSTRLFPGYERFPSTPLLPIDPWACFKPKPRVVLPHMSPSVPLPEPLLPPGNQLMYALSPERQAALRKTLETHPGVMKIPSIRVTECQ